MYNNKILTTESELKLNDINIKKQRERENYFCYYYLRENYAISKINWELFLFILLFFN
jgi:hypothetical protein